MELIDICESYNKTKTYVSVDNIKVTGDVFSAMVVIENLPIRQDGKLFVGTVEATVRGAVANNTVKDVSSLAVSTISGDSAHDPKVERTTELNDKLLTLVRGNVQKLNDALSDL